MRGDPDMPFKQNAKRSAAASKREAARKGRGDRPAETAAPDGQADEPAAAATHAPVGGGSPRTKKRAEQRRRRHDRDDEKAMDARYAAWRTFDWCLSTPLLWSGVFVATAFSIR